MSLAAKIYLNQQSRGDCSWVGRDGVTFDQKPIPLIQDMALERAVDGLYLHEGLHDLHVTTWPEVVIDVAEQLGLVRREGDDISTVYVVERLVVDPRIIDIINFEAAVRRHVFWLDGTQIIA